MAVRDSGAAAVHADGMWVVKGADEFARVALLHFCFVTFLEILQCTEDL